ncbi:unnamed protein product [Amoebophrya sp. A120]|nr:unnamed protein product [Amoebophrya sp. A120]|eukprot:GSA120T00024203001.1
MLSPFLLVSLVLSYIGVRHPQYGNVRSLMGRVATDNLDNKLAHPEGQDVARSARVVYRVRRQKKRWNRREEVNIRGSPSTSARGATTSQRNPEDLLAPEHNSRTSTSALSDSTSTEPSPPLPVKIPETKKVEQSIATDVVLTTATTTRSNQFNIATPPSRPAHARPEVVFEPLILSPAAAPSLDQNRRYQLDGWYRQISAMLPEIPNAVFRALQQVNSRNNSPYHNRRGTTPHEDQQPPLVLDIGANAGAFTGRIRAMCPTCRILAFECVPEYAAYIRDSRRFDKNLHVVPACVSDETGETSLFVASDGNLGWNTMVQEQTKGQRMREVKVKQIRLDDHHVQAALGLNDHGGGEDGMISSSSSSSSSSSAGASTSVKMRNHLPALIKIDTEGAEYKVLRGMRNWLQRGFDLARKQASDEQGSGATSQMVNMPVLMVEFGWGVRDHPQRDAELEMFDFLTQNLQYSCTPDYRTVAKTQDLVFLPPSKYSGGSR